MRSKFTFKRTVKNGYTLLELMVTVGILAITVAVGAPQMGKVFSTAPENEEIETLRAAIQEVRNRAITGDMCSTVRVVSETELEVNVYEDCGPPLDDLQSSRIVEFRRLKLANFDTGATLQFVSTGGTTENGPAAMAITTETSKLYEVNIMPAIGNIRIKKKSN